MKRKNPEEKPDSQTKAGSEKPYKGCLFIVSAPSGAGKSTICRAAQKKFPDISYSISFTTRPPRAGEKEGVDYFFISPSDFEHRIQQGEWAEWAKVHGHYYGTSAEFLNQQLSAGRRILLDIDIVGAEQILKRFPDSVTIFIMPPSLDALRQRLQKRGTDDAETIKKRLIHAEKEIDRKDLYRYVIVNDNLDKAIDEFCDIISRYPPA